MVATAARKRRNVFYGWWIVGASGAMNGTGGSVHWQGFQVFFLPVAASLNLSHAMTALPFSLARAENGVMGPLTGWMIDRFGVRPLMIGGTVMTGLGYILLSFTNSYTSFLLVYLFVISVGGSTTFMQASTTAINSWFVRRRGIAMAINSAAFRLGGAVTIPLLSAFVLKYDWQTASLWVGVFMLVFVTPLGIFFKRSPESIGQRPDGDAVRPPVILSDAKNPVSGSESGQGLDPHPRPLPQGERGHAGSAPSMPSPSPGGRGDTPGEGASLAAVDDEDWGVVEALKTSAFWVLALGTVLRMSAHGAIFVHLIAILVSKGQGQQASANMVGLMALVSVPLILLAGWASDRLSRQKLLAICYGASAASLLLLALVDGTVPLMISLFLFTGTEAGASLNWALVGDLFGRKKYATIRGLLAPIYNAALVVTPVAAGVIYDRTGSYNYALIGGAGLFLGGAVTFLLLKRPVRKAAISVAG
jgi:MFS family permease